MTGDSSVFETVERHQVAVVVIGFGLGIGISVYHYVGLIVGGLVLGLGARSVPRALAYAAGFGLTVWGVFGMSLVFGGHFAEYAATGSFVLLSGAIAVGLPVLAATVRGLR